MAANESISLLESSFQQPLDRWFASILEQVDNALVSARECTSRDCPIVGLHNTDECAELIAEAEKEGWR